MASPATLTPTTIPLSSHHTQAIITNNSTTEPNTTTTTTTPTPTQWNPCEPLTGEWAQNTTAGLRNCGNSCYMNSTLQALAHCRPLAGFFLYVWPYGVHPGSLPPNHPRRQRQQFKFVTLFVNAMYHMWSGNREFSPRDITECVIDSVPEFISYGQQDAHEAVTYILNNLHDECQASAPTDLRPGYRAIAQLEKEHFDLDSRARQARLSRNPTCKTPVPAYEPLNQAQPFYGRSMVGDLFTSMVAITTTCSTCGTSSVALDESFFFQVALPTKAQLRELNRAIGRRNSDDSSSAGSPQSTPLHISGSQLSGSIRDNDDSPQPPRASSFFSSLVPKLSFSNPFSPNPTITLDDCLRFHFKLVEKIDDYKCFVCDAMKEATQAREIIHLPEILCVQLKRFIRKNTLLGSSKISTNVRFPLQGLDLADYFGARKGQQGNDGCLYDLFAMIRHSGGMGSGHYTSVCLNRANKMWYEYDDEFVQGVAHPESVLQSPDAYILFYARRNSKLDAARKSMVLDAAGGVAAAATAATEEGGGAVTDIKYISASWVLRFETMNNPGPIDNTTFACPHGLIAWPAWQAGQDALNNNAIPVSASVYEALVTTYGRSATDTIDVCKLEPCETCRLEWIHMTGRREKERSLVEQCEAQDTQLQKQQHHGRYFYVSTKWTRLFKRFVINDIGPHGRGTFLGATPPGPVDNSSLLDPTSGGLKDKLKEKIDYVTVGPHLWKLFVDVYGVKDPSHVMEVNKGDDDADDEEEEKR